MGLKLNIAHVINSIPCTNEINTIQNFINGKKKKKKSFYTSFTSVKLKFEI